MGAVLPFARVAEGNDAAIFIADLHSLTSVKDGETLRHQTLEIATEYFAIYGIDTPYTIFRQSDIHNITKLMWILTNVTPYSLMLRAHSFKDLFQKRKELESQVISIEWEIKSLNNFKEYTDSEALEKRRIELSTESGNIIEAIFELDKRIESNFNMWVFNYPILMAADIIGYDCEAVPVGKDQIQHLEMTRDIARAFNKTYGKEVFTEPEAIIEESVATLPGIDGRKMSKSYDNFIGVFDDDKVLKKRVMSIVTGSEWVDEKKKNPDECNVFALYRVFATPEETATLCVKYESANIGFGYGHAKTALFEILQRYLSPYRAAREKLLQNPEIVEARLAEWARIMNARLDAKMRDVCEVVGVN